MGKELRPGMQYHIDIIYPGRPSSTKSITAIVKQGPAYNTAEAWLSSRGTVLSKYESVTHGAMGTGSNHVKLCICTVKLEPLLFVYIINKLR